MWRTTIAASTVLVAFAIATTLTGCSDPETNGNGNDAGATDQGGSGSIIVACNLSGGFCVEWTSGEAATLERNCESMGSDGNCSDSGDACVDDENCEAGETCIIGSSEVVDSCEQSGAVGRCRHGNDTGYTYFYSPEYSEATAEGACENPSDPDLAGTFETL